MSKTIIAKPPFQKFKKIYSKNRPIDQKYEVTLELNGLFQKQTNKKGTYTRVKRHFEDKSNKKKEKKALLPLGFF